MTNSPFARHLRESDSTTLDSAAKDASPGAERIFGRGEMAGRVRAFAWEQTSLGPIEGWPDELVWSLNSMLENRFPTSVLWGQDLLHFYNDAYLPLAAEKHPVLLGQPAAEQWAEAWHIIGPQFAAVLARGETLFQEDVLVPVRRQGVVRDVYWTYSYSPVRSRGGEVAGVLVVCHDVTSSLLLRRERDTIAADLERVFNSISDGVLVLNRDWVYTYFNQQGAAMIGVRPEDMIGGCVWELFPSAAGTRFYECYHRAIDTQQPVQFEEFYPAPLDKWIECHCFPTPQGLTVYFRDITERKRSEEALQRSEERFRMLFEIAPVGVLISDAATGQILFSNEEITRITGFSAAQLTQLQTSDFTHPEDRVRKPQQLQGAAIKRFLHQDGRIFSCRVSRRVLHGSHNDPWQILETVEDVTDDLHARKATEESEGRLADLVDSIPALAWMANPDGWIFWYNRRWYEYTGTTTEQMEGWGWQSVHDPATLPAVMALWQSSIATGSAFEMIFPLRGADGMLRSFLTRIFPLKNALGEVTRWFGTNVEIDELERTRQELAMERSQLSAVIENVPIGLVFADAGGRITGGNSEVERILRHPILFSKGTESYGEWISYHPDGKPVQGHEYPLARTFADGLGHTAEYLYRRGDGTLGWVAFTSAPIRDAAGKLIGGVVATLDIDERKRAQEELREKNELVELAQTAARAGFWQYYPNTGQCYLSFGAQQLFELEGAEMVQIGQVVERIHPDDRERVQGDLEVGRISGFYQSTFRVSCRDREVCWLSGQARLMQNAKGEPYFAGFNLDITSQRRAEEALRKSEKLAVAGRLAATISHEINNPLEAVTNLLYILRTSTSEEHTRKHIQTAEEELARVSEIVTHSLRFHRSSAAPTLERLPGIVDSAAAIYKSRLSMDKIRIERRYRDDTAIWCFSSELRQVFGNLIGNAFDAMRNGGVISLRARNATEWTTGRRGVRVTVADTGYGMDGMTIKRIAEPFYTTKGANGTGLGLWISRDLLKKHDATLRIRSSRKEGRSGSVFSVFLPVNSAARIAASAAASQTTTHSHGAPVT